MAKFTKWNNPNKHKKHHTYSDQYYQGQKEEMYRLLATAKDDKERDLIVNAFNVSLNS